MFFPKDDRTYKWTSHIKSKMVYYRFSAQMIKNILSKPDRREMGIAPNTMAVMKRRDTPKRKEEMWVMYSKFKSANNKTRVTKKLDKKVARNKDIEQPIINTGQTIMISAWRYPGVSKAGKDIPIPEDILTEVQKWFASP
ncbi:MAG: hypothetical protein Q8O87_01455 [bacterium]|nr:hypothetical protein [bacterium]